MEQLLDEANLKVEIDAISNFPGMERDWTITASEDLPYAKVVNAILAQASPILEQVYITDIYKDEKLKKGFHNLTLRFKYRDPAKTLELANVEAVHKRLTSAVADKFKDEIIFNSLQAVPKR